MMLIRKFKILVDRILGYNYDNPEKDGEYRFLKKHINTSDVVFDVGANTGYYSKYLLNLDQHIFLHCFEPVEGSYAALKETLAPLLTPSVFLNNIGLSSEVSEMEMNIYWDSGGVNSLYYDENYFQLSSSKNAYRKKMVQFTTLDNYAAKNGIEKIHFLKIDVEGHELSVVKGAIQQIKEGRVNAIQFEYGNFWSYSKSTLKEMFELLDNYKIYRLTFWGNLPVKYSGSLENYKHCNYLAILNQKV